ncbi:MAG: hypothetical protein ACYTEQ_26850 [Planctomycetota bacterium]|jgi:hypothetical protein
MAKKVITPITECSDCSHLLRHEARKQTRWNGECTHPDAVTGDSWLPSPYSYIPKWCPLPDWEGDGTE